MQKRPAKKKKKVNSAVGAEGFVIAISMIFFVISIGGSIFGFLTKDEVATTVVLQGSLDKPMIMNGIIIRNETVYHADLAGEVVFHVPDGERIRRGTIVSSIQNDMSIALVNEQEKLQEQILWIQEERSQVSSVSSDVAEINASIGNIFSSNVYKITDSNFSHIYTLQESVLRNLEHRNELLLNENRGTVSPYTSENRQFSNRIGDMTAAIRASSGGVVSYIVDGFEDVFDFENMRYITEEQASMVVEIDPLQRIRQAEIGDSLFKVINSNDWYIASYIPNELIQNFSEGMRTTIYIELGGRYEPILVKVFGLYKGEKESFVIFESTRRMIDFISLRSVNFQTYDSIFTGLKIPEAAIVEKAFLKIPLEYVSYDSSRRMVVTRLVNGSLQQILINTKTLRNVDQREGYVYVMQDFNNLRRGDVIVHPENGIEYSVEEIVTSRGVYRTNNGVASFTSINTEDMITGSAGYVILNTERNFGGLNVYDRIVIDAVNININEGDIIH